MIPMFVAIWLYGRHGKEAAVICALTWGVLDVSDHILKRYSGKNFVEHIISAVKVGEA